MDITTTECTKEYKLILNTGDISDFDKQLKDKNTTTLKKQPNYLLN